MIIRVNKNWKDVLEKPDHVGFTRRDFLQAGLLTGVLGLGLPTALMRKAMADSSACPAPVRNLGALAQYHCDGGWTGSCAILSNAAVPIGASSVVAQALWGIDPTSLQLLNNNFNIAANSAFGARLLAGAPGFTPGPTGTWATQVLKNVALYQVLGAHVSDDGGMPENQKLGSGAGKNSTTKDVASGVSQVVSWANGTPTNNVSNLSIANVEKGFSLTPSTRINLGTMTNAANAAQSLSSLFGSAFFGAGGRKGYSNVQSGASCGFFSDVNLTSPTYGATLFDVTQMSAYTNNLTGLSTTNLGMLAAYNASAAGNAGAVVIKGGGYDYHGQSATTIGGQDVEAAEALVMFLLACKTNNSKGAFIFSSNGSAQAGQGSTAGTTLTVNGNATGATTITATVQNAAGDAGGQYSACHLILCDYTGAALPPGGVMGTFNIKDGTVSAGALTTPIDALSQLYLTAAKFLGQQTVNYNALLSKMAAAGVSSSATSFI